MALGRASKTPKAFRHQHLRMKHLFNYLNETWRVIIVHWAGAVKNRPFCHRAYKHLEFVWACQLKCASHTWLTFFHRGGYILSNANKKIVHQSCVNQFFESCIFSFVSSKTTKVQSIPCRSKPCEYRHHIPAQVSTQHPHSRIQV